MKTAEHIVMKLVGNANILPTSMTDVVGARQAKQGEQTNTNLRMQLLLGACAIFVHIKVEQNEANISGKYQQIKMLCGGALTPNRTIHGMSIVTTAAINPRCPKKLQEKLARNLA